MPTIDPKTEAGYYEALGKFIHLFAHAEDTLFFYLQAGWHRL
jgi:hypothetical protein